MTDWDDKIVDKLAKNKHDAEDYYFYIEIIKHEIKSALEEASQHVSDNCTCGFCQRKWKVYKSRGIT